MARVREELGKELGQAKLETFGIELDHHSRLAIASVQHAVDEARANIIRAKACLRALVDSKVLPVQGLRIETLIDWLDQGMRVAGKLRPVALCPACKRVAPVMAECATCIATGYVTVDQLREVDELLLDTAKPVVRYRGALLPVERFGK
jgi:hypothetical protein